MLRKDLCCLVIIVAAQAGCSSSSNRGGANSSTTAVRASTSSAADANQVSTTTRATTRTSVSSEVATPKAACQKIFGDLAPQLNGRSSAMFQGHKVVFADVALTSKLLTSRDSFYEQMSPLDRQILAVSKDPIDNVKLDADLTKAARNWDSIEISEMRATIAEAQRRADSAGVNFKLPSTIVLAKTSAEIYSGSPYTRCATVFSSGTMLPSVLLHEFVHIVSRYNPEFRATLYPMVGYAPCIVSLSSLGDDVRSRVITNPDTEAFGEYCITLKNDAGLPTQYVPLLIGTGEYSGKADGWTEILDPVLVEVVNDNAVVIDGVTSRTALFTQQYMEAVGLNGEFEPFHPEELVAINLAGAIVPEDGIFPNRGLVADVKAAFIAL